MAVALAVLCGMVAFSQKAGNGSRRNVGSIGGTAPDSGDEMLQRIQVHAALERNAARQKTIVSDSQRLLKLATELNDEASKSGDARPSAETIKRIDEIAKLAKHVKDKMKGDL